MIPKTFVCAFALAAASGVFAQADPLRPEQAVDLAFRSRPVVAAAKARIQEARMHTRALGALPATRLNFGRGSDQVPGATDNDLALVQPLDLFGVGRASARTGSAAERLAEVDLRAVRLNVQNEALSAYNELVAAQKRLTVARDLNQISKWLRDAAKRRVVAGEAPEVHLIRANIEFDRSSQALELLESHAVSARQRLAGVIGAFDQASPDAFFALTTDLPEDLSRTKPELLSLAGEAESTDAKIRLQKLANRPEIQVEARRSPWMEDAKFGVRLQVSVPIFDSGRNRSEVRALELQRDSVKSRLDDARRLAEAELKALQTDREAAATQVARLEKLLVDARTLLDITQRGFDGGALTLVETLESTRALREVEESVVEARLRLAQVETALTHAAGHLLVVNP